jgi:hypothetical protein
MGGVLKDAVEEYGPPIYNRAVGPYQAQFQSLVEEPRQKGESWGDLFLVNANGSVTILPSLEQVFRWPELRYGLAFLKHFLDRILCELDQSVRKDLKATDRYAPSEDKHRRTD